MDWNFFINRWIIPLFGFLMIVFLQIYHKYFIALINRVKNKNLHFQLKFYVEGLRVEFKDWKNTILYPAFFAIILNLALSWFFQTQMHAQGEVLWFALLTSGFLSPITEEALVRGIGLGSFVIFSKHISKRSDIIDQNFVRNSICLCGVLLVSFVFTISHGNFIPLQVVSRFLASLLYSLLYLKTNRNLLPPIVAHSSFNLSLILNDTFFPLS